MAGNTFGTIYKITTFGESHGKGIGVVIDGCPPGIDISMDKIQNFLNRRRPGQSILSTPRSEQDQIECLSGLEGQKTLGTPLTLMVRNKDAKKSNFDPI